MQTESTTTKTSDNLSLREKIGFYLEDTETYIGLSFNLSILGLIFISSAIFVIQTYPIGSKFKASLAIIDYIILIVFAVEYALRLWSAKKPQKYLFSLFGMIDLISIVPLFFGWTDISFIRIFRWFRILRII